MSKLDKLIEELCPNGVEYKSLKEIAVVSGAGVDKKINTNEQPIKLLNYMDVYRNNYIDSSLDFMEVTASENKISQCNVLEGDVFITPSSEVLNDIGNAAVITEDLENVVYSYHIMRIRLKKRNFITSKYMGYIFESNYVQTQINRYAEGITRYGLTKTKWEGITIPLPPLPVQEEIVRILDNFTELTADLTAELTAREKQYEYYRDELLTFGDEVEWKTLGEIATYSKERIEASELNKENYIGVDNLLQDKRGKTESNFVPTEGRFTKYNPGNILIGNIRPYLRKIWFADNYGGTNGDVLVINLKKEKYICSKFLYYVLSSEEFFYYNIKNSRGAKMPRGNKTMIMKYKISIPPLARQERIVSILDKFDALVNDISIGLPAEIEARQKQYEYYREKLLQFKMLNS